MSYTYTTFVEALLLAIQKPSDNVAFQTYLPTVIDQAEQMCYRDLDLLATIVRNTSGVTTPNDRNFTLPTSSGRFVVLQSINILNNTSRSFCVKCSREVIDVLWPDNTSPSSDTVPNLYAPLTDQIIMFGPSPGSAFTVECIGTVRPAGLSASNANTFLSNYLPDLFFAAAMISSTAYNQDWGAEKDDPKMAMSWVTKYQSLLPGAQGEETKRKYQAFASV